MASHRLGVLIAALCLTVAAVLAQAPIPQDPAYHVMADQRTWVGIPNALNVLSNLPFALVGLLGISVTLRRGEGRTPGFGDPWERWPYVALFVGTTLTAIGSSYYHIAPDNARLVWDRLPMTLGFMGLLTAVLAERLDTRIARSLFIPLIALGASSVGIWYWTEAQAAGDLRFYVLVQFGSLIAIVLLLALYPARYSSAGYIVTALVLYLLAKVFELADYQILTRGQIVSGHTLKHIAAAAAVGCIVAMIDVRTTMPKDSDVSPLPSRSNLSSADQIGNRV